MATDPRIGVRIVSIVHEYLDHELGHWCRPCALSTGVRFWVAVYSSEGWMRLRQVLWCHECDGSDVVIDDDHTVT